jgi:ABC-type antimicrobial peptide transport system permease subunit
METIRNEFARIPIVENVTLSYEIPDGNAGDVPNAYRFGQDSTKGVSVMMLKTDAHYLTTYKIPMLAGKFFTGQEAQTANPDVIINETAAQMLGWNDVTSAIGGQIKLQGYNGLVFNVVGISKDFQFGTKQSKIAPAIFCPLQEFTQYRFLSFRVKPGNLSKAINVLQKNWSVLLPGSAFEYRFMDDRLKSLYKSEIQLQQASYTATTLAVIIVLLGVFGLVALNLEKRRREIGIRKVLGSSVASIIGLFVKEFLGIIFLAAIIACPLAYMLIDKWLSSYAYRIKITGKLTFKNT